MVGVVLAIATGALAQTRWYVVELQGQPAGWMTIERREAGELITTKAAMRVAVGRQGSVVVTAFESEVTERYGGNVVSMRRTVEDAQREAIVWRFEGNSVTVERDRQQTTVPAPTGVYVGPAAERAYLAERIAAGDNNISTRVVDPLSGLEPVPTVRERVESETLDLAGGPLEATRFTTRRGDEDRVVHEWLDAEGHLVRALTAIGAVSQEIILSDEATARRALARPPDLIDATRVTASRAIRGHERVRTAVFILRGGEQTPAISTTVQVAERLDDGNVRVKIDLDRATDVVQPSDDERAALLASTELLEADDDLVRELAARAVGVVPPSGSAAARAEAMRAFVHRYITAKTLDVALASAATVARERRGDCTEHAALLAAMLRAGDIPSRLVAGLIYEPGAPGAEPAFVYHVWTQALVPHDAGERWIDLDATQRRRPRHAAQIALSLSDGGNADDLWAGLAPTLGTISIDVETTR